MANISTPSHFFKKTGKSGRIHVILGAEGSISNEWNDLSDIISQYDRVLQYDRYGYGESLTYNLERTPDNITTELGMILNRTEIGAGVVLVGNSIGAYYASIFALKYPNMVQGLILVDPIFPKYNVYIDSLGKKLANVTKADPVEYYNQCYTKSSLGFLSLNKLPVLSNEPFKLYDFESKDKKKLLKFMGKKQTYMTAIDEFEEMLSCNEDMLLGGIENHSLKNIPLVLVTHNPKLRIEYLQKTYGINEVEATKVESESLSGMKKYLSLSQNTELITSNSKTRFIHLEDPDAIISAVDIINEKLD